MLIRYAKFKVRELLPVSVPVKGSFVVNKMAKTKEERIYVSVPVKGSFVVNLQNKIITALG